MSFILTLTFPHHIENVRLITFSGKTKIANIVHIALNFILCVCVCGYAMPKVYDRMDFVTQYYSKQHAQQYMYYSTHACITRVTNIV